MNCVWSEKPYWKQLSGYGIILKNPVKQEDNTMRKIKKLTAAITGAVLAFSVLFMPVIGRAESGPVAIKKDLIWSNVDFPEDYSRFNYDEFATTNVTVYAPEDMEVFLDMSIYADIYEVSECNKFYEKTGKTDYIKKEYEGMKAIDMWIPFNLYPDAGDIVEIEFPFPVPNGAIFDLNEGWSVDKISGNTLTLKCTDPIFYIALAIYFDRPGEEQFWFKPMKTQLAIAADIVATKGGTAVAEASGDFALSYEIMKYLDDHPGVTLKYTLTYKNEEHLIVIPGGGKCADPKIPWYGPEYLIGKFGR